MDNLYEIVIDAFSDAIKDAILLVIFLYITYVLMEVIEHKTLSVTQNNIRKTKKYGPILGALFGIVPQCGFSGAVSTLYAGRVVSIGTVVAVFLSTSDEMLPVLIASQVSPVTITTILLFKLAVGVTVGLLVDVIYRKFISKSEDNLSIHELCCHDKCHCCDDCEECKSHPENVYSHHENHKLDESASNILPILKSALIHTIKISIFIISISFVLNFIILYIGEDSFKQLIMKYENLSIILSGIVGLIPNCAASVLIADLFIDGAFSSGAMISGLLVSAGIGYLVLFRTNRRPKENIGIVLIILLSSILVGFIINILNITF